MTSDTTTELTTWSDHVIHWLLREEEISPTFRLAAVAELARREAETSQPSLTLTREGIDALGAINARQLSLLGLKWPPQSGWRSRLLGREIKPALYAKLLANKGRRPPGMTKAEWRKPALASLDKPASPAKARGRYPTPL